MGAGAHDNREVITQGGWRYYSVVCDDVRGGELHFCFNSCGETVVVDDDDDDIFAYFRRVPQSCVSVRRGGSNGISK